MPRAEIPEAEGKGNVIFLKLSSTPGFVGSYINILFLVYFATYEPCTNRLFNDLRNSKGVMIHENSMVMNKINS